MTPEWSDDDDLFNELGAALTEPDRTPESIARSGRDVYVWRTFDAELSELLDESATTDQVLVRDAGTDRRRSLTLRASQLTIELDVERSPDAIRGQVVVNVEDLDLPTEILVEVVDGTTTTAPIDAVGYFAVDPFPQVNRRFRLRCGDVVTPWIM